jgi:hypothetical protein
MALPQWLVQFGSIAGLGTLVFTIWDRLFSSRPLVWVRPNGPNLRYLHCKNIAQFDITIKRIRCIPKIGGVASDDSGDAVFAAATIGDSFLVVLKPQEEREFPVVIRRGELLNKDNTDVAPFCILVSWRKNSSPWLPQIPKAVIASVQSLRQLSGGK